MALVKINRQFPVGLFQEQKAEGTHFFTGHNSMIDLWTICREGGKKGNTLAVMELKTENKMVGAVTEAFFYANYMRDMFVEKLSSFQPASIENDKRGYKTMMDNRADIARVKAILLLDKNSIHPIFSDKLLDTLNHNVFQTGEAISYDIVEYGLQYQRKEPKQYIVKVTE